MGRAQHCPKSVLRIGLGFGFSGFVCFFLSQGFQKCWERPCPVEGRWALPAEAGSAWQPDARRGPARPPRWLLPCRAVWFALWVKFFSKLLLLSALFPPKNGQRPPSSLRTLFFFLNRAQICGVFCCLVNTHLALIRLLCIMYLPPLLGDLLLAA